MRNFHWVALHAGASASQLSSEKNHVVSLVPRAGGSVKTCLFLEGQWDTDGALSRIPERLGAVRGSEHPCVGPSDHRELPTRGLTGFYLEKLHN